MNSTVIFGFRSKDCASKPERRGLHKPIYLAIRRALRAVANRMAQARRAQRVFDELNAMSDHDLEDIGLTRSDIPEIVAGTYPGMQPEASNVIPLNRRRCKQPSDASVTSPTRSSAA